MTAQNAPTVARLAAEVATLRELVLDQGQAITALERRMGVHDEFVALAGRAARREDDTPAPYAEAASVQARRRSMHTVPALGEVAR